MRWNVQSLTIDSTSWTPVTAQSYCEEIVVPAIAANGAATVDIKGRTVQGDSTTEFTINAGNELPFLGGQGRFAKGDVVVYLQSTTGTVTIPIRERT